VIELTLEQKIDLLERLLVRLKKEVGVIFLCLRIKYLLCELWGLHYCELEKDAATIHVPELLQFKPLITDEHIEGGWWPSYDWDTRISVVETILQNLYIKQADERVN
jgi:hypothetical protein